VSPLDEVKVKAQVLYAGNPEHEAAMLPVKPASEVTVKARLPEDPFFTVRLAVSGVMLMATGLTINVVLVDWEDA
jgi:hypothetical protein